MLFEPKYSNINRWDLSPKHYNLNGIWSLLPQYLEVINFLVAMRPFEKELWDGGCADGPSDGTAECASRKRSCSCSWRTGLWLAGNAGMEKNMEIILMGYIRTTISLEGSIPSFLANKRPGEASLKIPEAQGVWGV